MQVQVEKKEKPKLIKVLWCDKCQAPLCPVVDDFIVGYMAADHTSGRTTHKLRIKEVEGSTQFLPSAILSYLLAKGMRDKLNKQLYGET